MSEQALDRIQRQLNAAEEAKRKKAAQADGLAVDEDEPPTKKKKQLSAEVLAGMAAGNINITSEEDAEHAEMSSSSKAEQDRQSSLLSALAAKRKEQEIVMPGTDEGIITKLRELGEPITLFGELPADRRIRLRKFLASQEGIDESKVKDPQESQKAMKETDEVWYHRGGDDLLRVRKFVASYSLPRARERLKASRLELAKQDRVRAATRQQMITEIRRFTNYGSQVGATRPLAFCRFSPDGSKLATAAWSGEVKLWSIPNCTEEKALTAHKDRASGLAWHPKSLIGMDESAVNLASCSADRTVKLWSLSSDKPLATVDGFLDRVSRVEFHPSGTLLGATSFDYSWRLIDVETSAPVEVLHQEGHSRAAYDISFHPDGSLCGTSSVDCSGRIWDLRTGKNIMLLQGHTKQVLCLQFSPNGYHIATGSDDNSIRIWDLRKRQCVYTLPAHNSLVSGLRYHPSGNVLVSSSYDQTVKVWTSPECAPLKVLEGHAGKVMGVDISPDAQFIASSSWDRTFKLWAREE